MNMVRAYLILLILHVSMGVCSSWKNLPSRHGKYSLISPFASSISSSSSPSQKKPPFDSSALDYMLKPEYVRSENENALYNAGLLILQSTNRIEESKALAFFEAAIQFVLQFSTKHSFDTHLLFNLIESDARWKQL